MTDKGYNNNEKENSKGLNTLAEMKDVALQAELGAKAIHADTAKNPRSFSFTKIINTLRRLAKKQGELVSLLLSSPSARWPIHAPWLEQGFRLPSAPSASWGYA